ncbi:MAG: efflux RND transporter periplasmic adaptor subunit [Pseudomonadota bacterium]
MTISKLLVLISVPLLFGCLPEDDKTDVAPPVRGLVTALVEDAERTTVRRYPGVMEPGALNVLSFEVGGRMGRLSLDVGERVSKGQLLAELDSEQFETQVENRQASVEEAQVTLDQAEADLERSQKLLDRGSGTVVQRNKDRTAVAQSRARLVQAQKNLVAAEEDLSDAKLYAPFEGIIDSIEVESFATVSVGQTVLSLYEENDFEVSFSVSFDVIGKLVVGTPAVIRLADDPTIKLTAVVSELGERAGQVSSFPVVVELLETSPIIKAGMAVEVAFEFPLPAATGHLIPISAAIPDVEVPEGAGPDSIVQLEVFVFDVTTSTVQRREVTMAGLRANKFLIIDGLTPGERVAIKGVTFLREGMEVRLLPDHEAN